MQSLPVSGKRCMKDRCTAGAARCCHHVGHWLGPCVAAPDLHTVRGTCDCWPFAIIRHSRYVLQFFSPPQVLTTARPWASSGKHSMLDSDQHSVLLHRFHAGMDFGMSLGKQYDNMRSADTMDTVNMGKKDAEKTRVFTVSKCAPRALNVM